MEWWNQEIDERTAVAFLKECQRYTEKAISKNQPDIKARRFSHRMPTTEVPFIPFGAVVHTTRTKTVWDAMRVVGSEAYGTHFIIATHKGIKNAEFELLSSVPCTILMPMGWEAAVPHSSYLSTVSWGIDLRNVGKLRPWRSPIGSEPTPIFVGEENVNTFRYVQPLEPSFYWWENLWRSKFDGHVDKWFDFYYEVPTFGQIKSLIILLRVLNALNPLNPRFVLPASCVRNIDQVVPHVPWEIVRHFAFEAPDEKPTMEDFNYIFKRVQSYGDFTPTPSDDIFTTDNAKMQRWRNENDDGMLHFILNGPKVDFTGTRYGLKSRFIEDLDMLGYDTRDPDLAARLLVAAHRMNPDRLDDVVAATRKKVEKLQG